MSPKVGSGGRPKTRDVEPTALGARLRELRVDLGYSVTRMATEMHTGSNRISEWENGHAPPTLPVLRRYADVFGITVSELIDGVV